jgi:hypothetical protein
MPVETSAPVAGQTKTSVPMFPSVTRPAQQNETATEHATQDGSHATQYDLCAAQYNGESCDRRKVSPVPRPGGQRNCRFVTLENVGH